jgi:hypothetical protein
MTYSYIYSTSRKKAICYPCIWLPRKSSRNYRRKKHILLEKMKIKRFKRVVFVKEQDLIWIYLKPVHNSSQLKALIVEHKFIYRDFFIYIDSLSLSPTGICLSLYYFFYLCYISVLLQNDSFGSRVRCKGRKL